MEAVHVPNRHRGGGGDQSPPQRRFEKYDSIAIAVKQMLLLRFVSGGLSIDFR
jgi:hypothetical protein